MNPLDDQLNRLFHAASQVKGEPLAGPAFGLETRALAAWRSARSVETGFWDVATLMRGLILASVIMGISLLPALRSVESSDSTTDPFADYLQLTDSTVSSDDTQ